MPYTFTITEVVNSIGITSNTSPVTVNVENIQFTVTQTSQSLALIQYLNTVTLYENAIELKVDDFSNYFKGAWTTGTTYLRGDLVDYTNSLFVSSIATATSYVSTTDPATDTSHWRRVVWHEAPFTYLTVNGTATIQSLVLNTAMDHLTATNFIALGNVSSPSLTITNTATIQSLVLNTAMDHLTATNFIALGNVSSPSLTITNTATIQSLVLNTAMDHLTVTNNISAGSLSIGGGIGGNGLVINSTATFNGTATFNSDLIVGAGTGTGVTFNSTATFNNTSTFNGYVDMSQSTLTLASLTLAGILYPTTKGNYGQVLTTNGDNRALWENLGDLVYWSLSDDLATNGYNIVSHSTSNQLIIGNNVTGDLNARITLPAGGESIIFTATHIIAGGPNPIEITNGIKFGDGTIQTTAGGGGTVGPTGPQGDQGPRGFNGAVGPQGPMGYTGYAGSVGSQGNIGYTGSIGGAGSAGVIGYTGSQGYTGYTGSQGSIGYNGSKGYNGSRGDVGPTGPTGADGAFNPSLAENLKLNNYSIVSNNDASHPRIHITTSTANYSSAFLTQGTISLSNANGDNATLWGNRDLNLLTGTIDNGQYSPEWASYYDLKSSEHNIVNAVGYFNNSHGEQNSPQFISSAQINLAPQYLYPDTGSFSTSSGYINLSLTTPNEVLTNDGSGNINGYYYNRISNVNLTETGFTFNSQVNTTTTSTLSVINSITSNGQIITIDARSNNYLNYNSPKVQLRAFETNSSTATAYISVEQNLIKFSSSGTIQFSGSIPLIGNVDTIGSTATLTLSNTATIIGTDQYHSILRVNKIYDYSGTTFPFFPAGLQFGDQSVQRTAYEPDQGLLP